MLCQMNTVLMVNKKSVHCSCFLIFGKWREGRPEWHGMFFLTFWKLHVEHWMSVTDYLCRRKHWKRIFMHHYLACDVFDEFWVIVSIGGSRGGAPGACPPLRDPILSFWHTNFMKRSHLGSPRPPYEVPRPPYGKSWIRHWLDHVLCDSKIEAVAKFRLKNLLR